MSAAAGLPAGPEDLPAGPADLPARRAEAAPAAEAAVWVRGLNHRFGAGDVQQQVLFDIHLEVRPGELVILTGPSGCGKTTLLTLIGALRSVQEGSLRVLGREMRGLDKKGLISARRDIGFIFQAHNLLEPLTAAQNVSMPLALKDYAGDGLYEHATRLLGIVHEDAGPDGGVPRPPEGAARALVTGLLTHLKLGERVHHKPNQLSGGQKQRVAIARALINHPRLILADEPTAALDKDSSEIVIGLLRRLTRGGSTILVVTHDHRIMDRGDRVVAMKDGRVVSDILVDETVRVCVFLQQVSLFAGLTPGRLVEVAEKLRKETYPAGAAVVRRGEVGDKFYLIREGKVDVLAEDDATVVATLGPGQFFGEVALLEDKPRNATVVAREPVEVYALAKDAFLAARAAFEGMRDELMKVFAQRFRPTP
jgi:putative ABC transport system ATP-binding protein